MTDRLLKRKGKGALSRTWHEKSIALAAGSTRPPFAYHLLIDQAGQFKLDSSVTITPILEDRAYIEGVHIFLIHSTSTGRQLELATPDLSIQKRWVRVLERAVLQAKRWYPAIPFVKGPGNVIHLSRGLWAVRSRHGATSCGKRYRGLSFLVFIDGFSFRPRKGFFGFNRV